MQFTLQSEINYSFKPILFMTSTIFDLLMNLAKARGTQFVSVRGYENAQGEISNYVLNLGSKYENAKKKDIARLQAILKEDKFETPLQKEAVVAVLEGLLNPNENRSNGQTQIYEAIEGFPMLKRHIATRELYIYGSRISKKVLVKGVYKTVNSKPLTIEKDKVRKGLATSKLRLMKLGREDQIAVQGRVIALR